MNNTTEQANMQGLTPEEAKASLGLATRLGEQFLMSQAQQQMSEEAPVKGQEAPQQEMGQEMPMAPQVDTEGIKNEITASVKEDIQTIVKEAVKEEMGGLRKELKDALESEE